MAPPPKKRRIISDDEEDSVSPSNDKTSITIPTSTPETEHRPKTRSQGTRGTRAVVRSFPPTSPEKIKITAPAKRVVKKSVVLSPRKPKHSGKASVEDDSNVGQKRISNFLRPVTQGPSKKKKVSKLSFSQLATEEDDDLIESDFSDAWSGSEVSTNPTTSTRKNSVKTIKDVKAQTAIPKVLRDPRTWAEKHAPQSVSDLAVHKAKIAEVRGWLEQVLAGFSRQRLCVLHGPSGCGKTAVISALATEMNFDIIEWKNPMGTEYGQTNYTGTTYENLNTQFSEFLERSIGYETLDIVYSDQASVDSPKPLDNSRRQIIVLEDLPNIFSTSSSASSALKTFRDALLTFLSTNQPTSSPPIPCVLIISESLSSQSHATSITPHRLLGPQILNHHKVTSISFNKIAPTILQKSLEKIVAVEAGRIGMKTLPSRALIAGLGESGDIRSAINAIEFMMIAGDSGVFGDKNSFANGTKKTKEKKDKSAGEMNESERSTLELVTQRESSFGIFHALGKVIYNKRQIDPPISSSTSRNIQPVEINPEPPDHLRHFQRHSSLVDINSLIDTIGTDVSTFISGIHENYLTSCVSDYFLDHMDGCIDALSDSDILSPDHWEFFGKTLSGSNGLRQEELAFQTAVRGVLLSLPSPVKRPPGRTQIYYPMALRLWQEHEDIEGLISLFVADHGTTVLKALQRPQKYVLDQLSSSSPTSLIAASKPETTLDIMPYLHKIWYAHQPAYARTSLAPPAIQRLQRVVLFRGVAGQSEDIPDTTPTDQVATEAPAYGEEDEFGNVKTARKFKRVKELGNGQYGGRFRKRKDGGMSIPGVAGGENVKNTVDVRGIGNEEMVKGLVLSDDDIEDDDDDF